MSDLKEKVDAIVQRVDETSMIDMKEEFKGELKALLEQFEKEVLEANYKYNQEDDLHFKYGVGDEPKYQSVVTGIFEEQEDETE